MQNTFYVSTYEGGNAAPSHSRIYSFPHLVRPLTWPPQADKLYRMMLDLSCIKQRIDCDLRILSAYVLGSAVSGRMRPDSDLDIAILPVAGKAMSQTDLMELSAALSLAAGRNVDLGVLSSQNLIYASEAILKGERFFCRDVFKADLAAVTLLGLAVRFEFERREIVDAYTA